MQQNYVLSTSFSNEGTEPVALNEMKTYLRINLDETFNDALIIQLITTARQQLEGYLNISLVNKTVIAKLQIETGCIQLPYSADAISLTTVTDDSGNTLTGSLKGNSFSLTSNPWPGNNFYNGNGIAVVTYAVSYPNGLPTQFKTAVMQQVSYLYENRGDDLQTAISPLVKIGLMPYRKVV